MEYHSGGSLPLLGRPRYCPGANANGGYLCETGHCCGETGCCTYYYELWWFWLLWTVLILFSCCCAYRHRRAKLRVQQQQRQREISLLAYHGANSYPSSMLDLSFLASLKLPSYEEVAAQPSTPPPPYSSVFTTPRYPQPPRAADPHLLTQHDPLLHRPLSDGPSSFSSDNSSSCSCDSCCPSSPCSSSLSAPMTYETDTSHASTPSEVAPLALDVVMETMAAASTSLDVNETHFASERMVAAAAADDSDAAQEPGAARSSVADQTVTVAVVTKAASPQPLPSPGSDVVLAVGAASPIKQQLDLATSTSTCSTSTLPNPTIVNTTVPSILIISSEGPVTTPTATLKTNSMSGPPTPTASACNSPTATQTPETPNLTRTCETANDNSPTSVLHPDGGRTLASAASPGLKTNSPKPPSHVPKPSSSVLAQASIPASPNITQASIPTPSYLTESSVPAPPKPIHDSVPAPSDITQDSILAPPNYTQDSIPAPTNFTQASIPEPSNLTNMPDVPPKTTLVSDSDPKPAHSSHTLASDTSPNSPTLATCQNPDLSPGSGIALVHPSSSLSQHPESVSCQNPAVVPVSSSPSLVLSQSLESDPTSQVLSDGFGSVGSRSSPQCAPVLTFSTPASSLFCPAITIESASSFTPPQSSPAVLSPSSPLPLPSPPCLLSPPALSSPSLPAPALLLDPLTALHPSDKGGSSAYASSLSPSPRATQSPPKQTLFSPCVDVFEPGPSSWDEEEVEQEEEDNDDDEEDMGADESQYRHRRLTGDSGIEVCRCRVEDEDEDEEEEEEEEEERKEDGRNGGEREKKGGGNDNLHDSVDCPARGQITTGEGLTLCNPTSSTTPAAEDSGEVVIVMETV